METAPSLSSRTLQYYVMARQWASDLEFFKTETAFFHRLLNEYIVYLALGNYADKLHGVAQKLSRLEEDEIRASKMLTEQIKHLELMAEDVIPEDAEALETSQIQLEHLTSNLLREYRNTKKQLFLLIESAMTKSPPLL